MVSEMEGGGEEEHEKNVGATRKSPRHNGDLSDIYFTCSVYWLLIGR